MNQVFADTGYWQAVLNPAEQLHSKATEVTNGLGKVRLLTAEIVLGEFLAALARPPVRTIAIKGVDSIRRNPNVEVLPQTSMQFDEAFNLYRQHADKGWSLTDCASFIVMRRRGIDRALAHDRHVTQAGFVALLADWGWPTDAWLTSPWPARCASRSPAPSTTSPRAATGAR